jgi:hypothetical protein
MFLARDLALLSTRGGAGRCCDDKGVALGPFPLVTHDAGETPAYRPRSRQTIVRGLRTAYRGMIPELIDDVAERLERIANALNDGDHVHARILAVQMRVPELLPSAMTKLAKVVGLKKYNPNWEQEARVPAGEEGGGDWTDEGAAAGSDSEAKPAQVAANESSVTSNAGTEGDKGKYVVLNDGTTPKDHLGNPLKIPPGVSLEENALHGQSMRGFIMPDADGNIVQIGMMNALFTPRVGSMDYQRIFGTNGQINKDYIDFGNYNYGVVAAAAGYSYDDAIVAHGIVNQLGSGDKSGPWGGNPRDITMIRQGYDDYNSGKIVPLPKLK